MHMDKIDAKILEMLQKDARVPLKQIASEVYLSSPAVSARIERLEKEGVLQGYQALVSPMKLGYHIKAYVNLEISPSQKLEVYPYLKDNPNVLECDCVTGSYSVIM